MQTEAARELISDSGNKIQLGRDIISRHQAITAEAETRGLVAILQKANRLLARYENGLSKLERQLEDGNIRGSGAAPEQRS